MQFQVSEEAQRHYAALKYVTYMLVGSAPLLIAIVLLGIFSLNAQSLQGSLMLMINIGITSTALMFLTGILFRCTGSTQLSAFDGLARHVPKLAFFFFAIGLATIGTPGLAVFTASSL